MKVAFVRDNIRYSFHLDDAGKNDFLLLAVSGVGLEWENVYKIPVRDLPGYAYRINKRSMSADGGAYGLFKYIRRCVNADLNMVSVYKIILAFSADDFKVKGAA